jgi:hypothetical protein
VTNVWSDFVARVAARLEAGARQYGNGSFARPPAEPVGEIMEELEDVAGRASIMFARVSATAEEARRLTGAVEQAAVAEERRADNGQPREENH